MAAKEKPPALATRAALKTVSFGRLDGSENSQQRTALRKSSSLSSRRTLTRPSWFRSGGIAIATSSISGCGGAILQAA